MKKFAMLLVLVIVGWIAVNDSATAEACGWGPYKGYKNAKSVKWRLVDKLLEKKQWQKAILVLEGVPKEVDRVNRHYGYGYRQVKVTVSTVVSGERDKTVVSKQVQKKNDELRTCFLRHLTSENSAGGQVTLRYSIGAQGKVSRFSAQGFSPKVTGCAKRVLTRQRFTRHRGGASTVQHVLAFSGVDSLKPDKVHQPAFAGEDWYLYQLATAQYHLNRLNEARINVEKIQRISGLYSTWQVLLLRANLSQTLEGAITLAQQAVAKRPKDARMHASLGTFYEKAGQLANAEKTLANALRINRKHHGGMEWVHLEVIRFKRQLQVAPDSYKTMPFLGRMRKSLSEKGYQKALLFANRLSPELPIPSSGN